MTSRRLVVLAPLVLASIVAGSATAQVNMQLSGTIESIEGAIMVLRPPPPPARRVTLGESARPAPAPPPTLMVDLGEVPASQWVFLRPGERIAVVGVPSADGLRFAAIRVIGGAGPPRDPQAP
jgi:hypothetical protein